MSASVTMYEISIPVFVRQLKALSACLEKSEAHCLAKKIEPATMAGQRLIADMFPLSRQIQIACDFAKGAAARMAGVEVPAWDDNEKTLAELRTRIARTIEFVSAIDRARFADAATRDISIKIAGNPVTLKGASYINGYALPNFYFHASTAYAILRANGVYLGKRDFIGAMPA